MIGRFRELLPVAEEGEEGARLVTALLRRALALLRTGGEPLAAAASWGTCSIGMTLLNKRAIDKTGAPLGVLILQMLATVLVALSQHRRLHFGQGTRLWASTAYLPYISPTSPLYLPCISLAGRALRPAIGVRVRVRVS